MASVTTGSTRSSPDTSYRANFAPETDTDHSTEDDEEIEEDGDEDEEEGEDSENDGSSAQSEKWLDDPATDIEADLTRLLGGGFKFSGTFYSSDSFPEAPNPCLNIDGLGPVGLPLTEATAKSIIGYSSQAPFGKGERTVVDTTVRDTWEINAAKVHFNNPKWNIWMNDTVLRQVCSSLGVNLEKGKPRVELYKMLVYEKGSHFLPHKDTEKAPGMFATIIVILPSPFEGGNIHLSHAGKTKVIETSLESTFSTHVASWYTDVTHSVKPITSGYRLALSYNLIHTSAPSLKPSLAAMSPQLKELKHVLLSWKWLENPDHLVYLLDHQYSESNLRSTSVKGKDAHMLKNLRSVAEPLDFEIYLANIELHQTGIGDDEGETIVDMEMEEWGIDNEVDLDGNPADLSDISIDKDQVIPFELSEVEPDDIEGEGYVGNESGTVEIWYRRTGVIIVRPKEEKRVKNIVEYTKTHLAPTSSTAPSKDEQIMVDRLVGWAAKIATGARDLQVKEALQTLRKTAVRWKDAALWLKTCRAARLDIHIDMMGVDNVPSDIANFGFSQLRDFYDLAIINGRTDEMRFELAITIYQLGKQKNDETLVQWANAQNKRVVSSLRTLDATIVPILLREVENQGPTFLDTTLMPQLKKLLPKNDFWIPLITGLHSVKQRMPQHEAQLARTVAGLVQARCDKEDMFPGIMGPTPMYSWQTAKRSPDTKRWLSLVKLCFSTGSGVIAKEQLKKMAKKIKEMSLENREWVGKIFFPAAMKALDEYAGSNPSASLKEYLSEFFQMALQLHIEEAMLIKGGEYDLSLVPLALRWGGHQCLKGRLAFEIPNNAAKRSRDLGKLVLSIVEYRKTLKPEDETEKEALQKIVSDIALLVVKNDSLTPGYNYGYPSRLSDKEILPLTNQLISAGCIENLDIVFQKTLPAMNNKTGEDRRAYLEECLLPVLAGLAKQFKEASIEWPHTAVRPFASKVLNAYVRDVVGRKSGQIFPPTELLSFGCAEACTHCPSVRSFFRDSRSSLDISAAEKIRKHVSREIDRSPLGRLGFSYDTIRTRSPYTLRIQKPAQYASLYNWAGRQQYAAQQFAILGTLEMQREVMGSDWPDVYSILRGQAVTILEPQIVNTPTIPPVGSGTNPSANPATNASAAPAPSSSTETRRVGTRTSQRVQAGKKAPAKKPTPAPKRPFAEAMGAPSQQRVPEPKRPKLLNPDIIEISDSD